ncbi:MAG: LytTR family transcriptional regulator DNA-binding domain-containing protein [bacterium]|nr:LytTR family transcriptional regulator DNA-binding domain-containing protein [bacterium]
MINFIIYEDNRKTIELYREVITNFIGGRKDGYQIISFERYDDRLKQKISKLWGKNIFILDILVPHKSGLDLAKEIRGTGDWGSQIIIVSKHEQYYRDSFSSKMWTLEFVLKDQDISVNLRKVLNQAYKIVAIHKAFSFQYDGELYHIHYDDILFFEKSLYDNYSYLVTKNKRLKVKKSITRIERDLKDELCFFKTHRSCIINVHNVYSIDVSNNIISFPDGINTHLLTNKRKKLLKDLLTNDVTFC